jgi:hypothetical protein
VSFYREETNLMATSTGCDYMGNIQIKMGKGSKTVVEKISEEKFSKIMECINVNDVVPYEYSMKYLSPE